MPAHVLLTGATGFVGKVVLEQLVRRRAELDIGSITLIVRVSETADDRAAAARARLRGIVSSPLFASHSPGWEQLLAVVPGDLEKRDCGLAAADKDFVVDRATHVVHCAASIEFDLPVAQAASANIAAALEVLELARRCTHLSRMVSVSTAYVTPWRAGAIDERLAPLPRDAEAMFAAIRRGGADESAMLAETGHPNTYTLTKCIAEHLLVQRRGAIPLSIVRPSIVSASWRAPFPGWIDSAAALAGCLLYSGLGVVRAWKADPAVRLDVVPVDSVADEVVGSAFTSSAPLEIRHATMGKENALRVDLAIDSTVRFFRERPGAKRLPGMFVGTSEHGYARHDFFRRELPTQTMRAALGLTRRTRELRRLDKADAQVRYLNDAFAYFTHHTFDFVRSGAERPTFRPVEYLDVVLRGMYRHLVRKDETQESFAGGNHDDARSDIAWLRDPQRDGNTTMRALGLGLRAALRKSASDVTFDRPSFERAIAAAPPGAIFVLAPSHRSYLDFLLTSYLCFQHPELGIPVPHIAAAEEFGKLPVVGQILRESRAFYIKRGVGREAPELSQELRRLAALDASLMFFVEGQRSRSRLFLAPKRGLLRGLQQTGRTFAVLPIAMSYDRLPEEASLERELAGGERTKMRVRPLLAWLARLARGEVSLGRIHMACGDVAALDPTTNLHTFATGLVAQQQRATTVSSFHVRAFLEEAGLPAALGIDEAWLTNAIRARGGRVLASKLAVPSLSPALSQSLRNQWMHWFYGDAVAHYPNHRAVLDHVERNGWTKSSRPALSDPQTRAVVESLMRPVLQAYDAVVKHAELPAAELVRAFPSLHLPHTQDALRALAEGGLA